jgi:hypothetical protein
MDGNGDNSAAVRTCYKCEQAMNNAQIKYHKNLSLIRFPPNVTHGWSVVLCCRSEFPP